MAGKIGFNRGDEDATLARKQLEKAASKVKYWTGKLTNALAEIERLEEEDK